MIGRCMVCGCRHRRTRIACIPTNPVPAKDWTREVDE